MWRVKGSTSSIRGRSFLPGMSLPVVFLVLAAALLVQFPLADGYRLQRTQSSCYYNGTHFMEGSIVPTKEPCLMCKCSDKTLICALKVCPEQPIPPPRGCILVHKSGSCCPYLQCSKLNLAVKNNGDRKKLHFLDYYEKAAQERLENPNSVLRRSDDDEVEDNGACIVNGTVYKSGSAMVSSSLCSYCYCINGRQKCVKPKCALPSQKCAPVYVDSACCPIRYDCTGKTPVKNNALESSTASPNHVRRINNKHYQRMADRRGYRSNGCTYDGHSYPEGEKIKSEDPCEVCFCIRGQRKCTPKKCAPAIKGCTPRVPRGECCAIRYDCKHGEPKPFARKMEDEEESFDFFSILFGPDPDAPKEDEAAKNATSNVDPPVTEVAPVSTTSEKSFLDLLRAGLDFIDDAGEDELLLTSTTTVPPGTSTSTEPAPEQQTVKVEIIQEPQAIYIEKPDFNFPVRNIPPVPVMFKPLPKLPALIVTEPTFQNIESDSLLKEIPTEVSNSLVETTVKADVAVTASSESEQPTIVTTPATSTTKTTTTTAATTKTSTTTTAPTTTSKPPTTTARPTTTTTTTVQTTAKTTKTSTTIASTPKTTPSTTTVSTTTSTTTTTPKPTTTTTQSTTKAPTPAALTLPAKMLSTTAPSSSTTREITTQPSPTVTTKVEALEPVETDSLQTTTISPAKKQTPTTTSTTIAPTTTSAATTTPQTTVPSTTSAPSTTVTPKTTTPSTTTVRTTTTSSTTTTTSTTPKPKPSAKIVATTPRSVSSTPIDVVIKIDQLVDKHTVETLINSLNAKIENVSKVTASVPLTTTTIETKRPNNKFVGFEPEKIPTTVFAKVTTTRTTESIESSTVHKDASTTESIESDVSESTELDTTSTMKDSSERSTEEATSSTQTFTDSEETSTITSTVTPFVSTTDGEESESTIEYDTTTDEHVEEGELKTDGITIESKDTTASPVTTVPTVKKPPTTSIRPSNPLKENNLLSVLLSGLSNIFDATKNDSGKQSQKNRTEYRPVTPKPIPISGFHKVGSIPSILESDVGMDYDEPTLPPSLPNLKIIPFLPADAVKKSDPPKQQPASIVAPTYTYFKNHPNNYPIVNEPYETPTAYGIGNEHEILHPGLSYNTAPKPIGEYEYGYDPTLNYPALTENYEIAAKNGYYNTKIIRDKYDTVDETDYDYDTDTIHKYAELPQKQEQLFQNELKKFIPTKYEAPKEGTYVPVYDKYGVGYPEKNVYYTNHKELAYGGAKIDKPQVSTDNPLFRIDGTDMSGFSPPTKTEGGFVPKDHSKDTYYYDRYATTPYPVEQPGEEHHAKLPYNVTPTSSYGVTPVNPFIDVIRTEPAPPLMTLIEDKEKLLSTLHTNRNATLDAMLADPSEASDEYEKEIISITTDTNYVAEEEEINPVTRRTTPSKPNFTGFELNFPVSVHHPMEPVSPAPVRPSTVPSGTEQDPEPSGMFSLENMLNYLLREEDPVNENKLRNASNPGGAVSAALTDGIPPFKTLPQRLAAVYDPSVGLEASLGDVSPPSDEELHEGTVTLKVESAKNDTKTLYRPSLLDLPFLNPGFHTKPINQPAEADLAESQNELDRYHVLADGTPSVHAPSSSYVVNPVDINKLKQHHSEGTAEITMKSKVKDTVGILKLAGCNIYGRMYRVGRIISELSGPCLECKCTEVGVHCTPLDCRR